MVLPEGFVDGPGVREKLLDYYLEVSRFDYDVGRVVAELRKQGVLENTFVLVMSDNGRPFLLSFFPICTGCWRSSRRCRGAVVSRPWQRSISAAPNWPAVNCWRLCCALISFCPKVPKPIRGYCVQRMEHGASPIVGR